MPTSIRKLPKPKHRQLLLLLLVAAAQAVAYEATYVPAAALRLVEFLPPPPAAGSPEAAADLDAVLRAQAARTPATAAEATADARVSVFGFAVVLGPDFNAEKLPVTNTFFQAAGRDATRIGMEAKQYWHRPRPGQASGQVQPLLTVSRDDSYPSGHAMYGCLAAVLLGMVVPEQRAALLAQGYRYGENRVVAGVHFPTDVKAGCLSGKLVAAAMLQSERFRRDLAGVRAEIRQGLGLAAAPGGD